jgi:hypothetical protein
MHYNKILLKKAMFRLRISSNVILLDPRAHLFTNLELSNLFADGGRP